MAYVHYGTSYGEFKTRFNNHTRSFRHKRYSVGTELSKYMQKLSNDKIQYEVKWNLLDILCRTSVVLGGVIYASRVTPE